eukprot:TRINITY_DN1268_c1_g2_i1.p1 TRINITY_DN1268_c1_g2~~TRINITY_DN1268_c1_g2_i1.p1  ORF type:complete len:314 (+),score=30.81 TRINITY_DN1268_c1_g2_i1:41-982(+)
MAERARDGRKVFTKEECDQKRLTIKTGPCKNHWLTTIPIEVQKILKKNRGKLKICRTKSGKKRCILHLRDTEGGVLPINYCQKCSKKTSSQCCTAPLPWCSYKGLPTCEYCGTTISSQDHCGKCGTTEVLMMNTVPSRVDRPRCVMTEGFVPTSRQYSYQLESALISENMAMVTPLALQKSEVRLVQAAGWRCPDCGRSSAGFCTVTQKEHDIPIASLTDDSSIEKNLSIVKESGFDFGSTARKTDNEVKNAIIRVMSREPNSRWSLINITIGCFESKQDVKRVIEDVAYPMQDNAGKTTYCLKPGIKPFKLA